MVGTAGPSGSNADCCARAGAAENIAKVEAAMSAATPGKELKNCQEKVVKPCRDRFGSAVCFERLRLILSRRACRDTEAVNSRSFWFLLASHCSVMRHILIPKIRNATACCGGKSCKHSF